MTILVLGLGNPILTDDGVGVRVVEWLYPHLPAGGEVEVEELSVGGLTLMERMVGYDRVVLVDALITGSAPVGTVFRLTIDDLRSISVTQHSASPHDASLVTALELGRRTGLPLPSELAVVAVEVENVTEFGDTPSPSVVAAIPAAGEAVLRQLERWGALGAHRDPAVPSRRDGTPEEGFR